MSEKLILEVKIDSARAYAVSKGRLPKSLGEMADWLREYAEYETRRCDAIEQAYKEHLGSAIDL